VHDAIEKCIQRKNAAVSNGSMPQRIALASAQELLLVHADDIIRVEAQNNYSHFYFTNRPKLVVSKTLREFDHQLTPLGFYRVHQSHLVNLKHVEAVQSSDGDYALLAGNHRVEISRRQKADFLRLVKNR
jgi:two-component system LytT family response regulator